MKLGVHVSIAGNICNSIDRAKNLGCNTMQIFARNPRQWRKESISEEDIKLFQDKRAQAKIDPVVIHIPYSLNLAATKDSFYNVTIKEFSEDLKEADRLGADYLVTHMGSFKGSTERNGLEKITESLRQILANTEKVKTKILLENTAGSGSWLGYKFSHFRFIFERLGWPERVGICLDTAHAWAAGYKIDELDGLNGLLSEIKEEAGLERIKVVHLNDTKEKLGSRHDRHADIGRGLIGKKGFYFILNHPDLKNLTFILETPKEGDADDFRNLKVVRQLYYKKIKED